LALDARIVIYEQQVNEDDLPQLAIRPYPTQYIKEITARDGSPLTIRPIRAEDEPALVDFHESLSDRSVYLRFLHPLRLSERAKHDRLSRICHGDYNNEIALIVEDPNAGENQLQLIAASRMTRLHGSNVARFSMLVSDCCQGQGIGKELMKHLIEVARQEKYEDLECLLTPDNQAMRKMVERFDFKISDTGDELIRADLNLK
jgi:acetyltransferase